MRKKHTSGFTLIELLVVIAIIGILSAIVLVSLSSARARSRDTQRVTSLKEMAKAISLADADPALSFGGCNGALASNDTTTTVGGIHDASVCNSPSPVNFVGYKDPSAPTNICRRGRSGTSAGDNATPCQYAIYRATGAAGSHTTQDYEICSALEVGAGSLNAGRIRIASDTGGSVVQYCQ